MCVLIICMLVFLSCVWILLCRWLLIILLWLCSEGFFLLCVLYG